MIPKFYNLTDLMITDIASELGEDASTFTILEEQDFEVPDEDVVVVHLACGAVPMIVTYKNGVEQTEQGVFLLGKEAKPCDPQCDEDQFCNDGVCIFYH